MDETIYLKRKNAAILRLHYILDEDEGVRVLRQGPGQPNQGIPAILL